MVVNGDITQIDLEKNQESGLIEASRIFSETEGIKFCYLTIEAVSYTHLTLPTNREV